jgi:hypothetical protein
MYVTGHCREVDCQISGVSCRAPDAVLTISYANSTLREIEEPWDYSDTNYLKSQLECRDYIHSAPGLADAVIQDLGSLSGEMADWESSRTDKRMEYEKYAVRTWIQIILLQKMRRFQLQVRRL